ncbi:MAG: NAD-dependent dehydratase [Spirochaetes bacterium RBG_16_49_21]|nr:MAG: NAD-dependent dehydratase [Spirochaetes bacterium RBG_16_49_21]
MGKSGKALVTGGCGFIGSHLVDLLLIKGMEVIVIDNFSTGRLANLEHQKNNNKLKIVTGDISNLDEIDGLFEGVDYVFHLAALADIVPSIENPLAYHRSNVDGTINLLIAASKHTIRRLVYTASSSCYGIADNYPTKETDAIKPQYPYALTKYLGELYIMHWSNVYKLPAVSLRLFNVYGPRSRTSGTYGAVFGVFLKQKLAGKPFTVVGDGNQTRDFTYVTDVANALWMAAESDVVGEIMNVGSGDTYSVNRLIELLKGEKIFIPHRPGEPDCTFADTTKIRKLLGWKPRVSFEEGVQKVLASIEYWKDAPLWDPQSIAKATETWFKYLS